MLSKLAQEGKKAHSSYNNHGRQATNKSVVDPLWESWWYASLICIFSQWQPKEGLHQSRQAAPDPTTKLNKFGKTFLIWGSCCHWPSGKSFWWKTWPDPIPKRKCLDGKFWFGLAVNSCSFVNICIFFVMTRINMEMMIKVVKWAVTGFTACPKLNSKNISGKKFLCINIQEVNTGMQ